MAVHPFAIAQARQFGRFRQDTGGNVCELNFTSEESVSEISTVADRYLRKRGRRRDLCRVSFCLKRGKKKVKKSEHLPLKKGLEIGKRLLSCRGYRRQKIVHTFKVTRVSCGFKRLSRLTLSPEQFKLVLFSLVCMCERGTYFCKVFWRKETFGTVR